MEHQRVETRVETWSVDLPLNRTANLRFVADLTSRTHFSSCTRAEYTLTPQSLPPARDDCNSRRGLRASEYSSPGLRDIDFGVAANWFSLSCFLTLGGLVYLDNSCICPSLDSSHTRSIVIVLRRPSTTSSYRTRVSSIPRGQRPS